MSSESESEVAQSMDSDSEEESIEPGMEEESGLEEEESGEDEANEIDNEAHDKKAESKEEDDPKITLKRSLYKKFQKKKGKSLFIHFGQKLTTDAKELEENLKELCSRIIRVRRPRQKNIQRCMVDFSTREDCAKAKEELQSVKYNGKKLHVELPKTEKDEYIDIMVERILQRGEIKRAKQKIKNLIRKRDHKPGDAIKNTPSGYTSTLIVMNIPAESNLSDIKQLFPHAIDVSLKPAKGDQSTALASVTLPTPKDATKARRRKYELGGNNLRVVFSSKPKKDKKMSHEKNAEKNGQPASVVKAESEEQNSGLSSTKHKKNKNKKKNPTHKNIIKDEKCAAKTEGTQRRKRKSEDNTGIPPVPKKMKKAANSSEVHVKSLEENSGKKKKKMQKQKQLGKKSLKQKEVKDQEGRPKAIKKAKHSQFVKSGGEMKAKKLKGDKTKKNKK